MLVGFWWKSQKERDHYEELDVGGKIILKLILEASNVMLWTGFIWFGIGTS
jgi:hypothetical protein